MPNPLRRTLPAEIIIFAILLAIWWSILNLTSELKWRGYDFWILPLINNSKELAQAISAAVFVWRIALAEWVVPTPRRLAYNAQFG